MRGRATASDDDLIRLMLEGDEDAFTTLYRRRHPAVYRFALQMSGSPAIAEDVTQDVFMALMRDGAHFDPSRGTLPAYLYGIARNQVLRRLGRDRFYVPMAEDADDDADSSATLVAQSDPLVDLTRSETIEAVRTAVLALPEHYREVVVLCDLHEMNYAEAAEVLGCAIGTVRSRLHRARALLVQKLRATAGPEPAPRRVNSVRCFA